MVDKLLNTIIKIYPEETVLKNSKVFFSTTYTNPLGKNEIPGSFNSDTSSISMIETNKKYYFDVKTLRHASKPRLPFSLSFLIYSLLIILSMVVIYRFTHQSYSPLSNLMFFIVVFVIFGILFALEHSLKGARILIVKKEWITQASHKNKEHVIRWALPKEDRAFSGLKLLGREMQVKTSLFHRMQRAFLIVKSLAMNMEGVFNSDHSYSYKEV